MDFNKVAWSNYVHAPPVLLLVTVTILDKKSVILENISNMNHLKCVFVCDLKGKQVSLESLQTADNDRRKVMTVSFPKTKCNINFKNTIRKRMVTY